MLSVSRTLSLRYLAQRWPRVLLIVLSIALGVATLLATRSLDQTMVKAAGNVANPLAGIGPRPVVAGKELYEVLQQLPNKGKLLHLRTAGKPAPVTCVGPVDGRGVKSVLGGYVLFMDLRDANASLKSPPLLATRIDVT